MDLESKLTIINQSIQGLKQTQKEMRRRLTSDIAESSENVMADFGKLSDHVYRLEVQFGKQYGKLKEVTKLVLILLDKVKIISTAIENTSCFSDRVNNGDSEGYSLNSQNGTFLNIMPSEKERASDQCTPSSTTYGSNGAPALESKDVEDEYNPLENEHQISTITASKIKNAAVSDRIRNNNIDTVIKVELLPTGRQDSLQNDANFGRSNTTNTSTETGQNFQIQSVPTERLRKNDFGYKQKRSDMISDNRVDFHSNQTPYPSSAIKTTTEPNIKPKQTQSFGVPQSGSSAFYGDFGDNGYLASSDDFVPPQDIHGWLNYAQQITCHLSKITCTTCSTYLTDKKLFSPAHVRLKSGKVKRGGHGHDVILVLDTSERMKGSKFEEIKRTALQYVTGIQQVCESRGLKDNIGLAVFGKETRLVYESTCSYDLIKNLIHQLKPEGESPLICGLIMGMAGVLGGAISQIMENEVQGHMIVFTDGTSEHVKPQFERGHNVNPLYLTGDFREHADTSSVIHHIATHSIKIFYVPVGQHQNNAIMAEAVRETNGKIIMPCELHRLVKMTQVMLIAARVASEVRHSPELHDRESIGRIIETTGNSGDRTEDCVDMVREFVNPMNTKTRKGMFAELKCRTLQLGDRVRRGPYWTHDNQDSNRAGTIVGQGIEGNIWVEWDNGHVNVYLYNEAMKTYSIKKVNEPRILNDEMIAVGCRVERAHDWTSENEDGGPGSAGTVLNVKQDGNVVVRWDSKVSKTYKVGCNGLIEVKVCNDSIDDRNRQQQSYQSADDSVQSKNEKNSKEQFPDYFNYNLPVNTRSATWEYQENESTWKEYPTKINIQIEKAYQQRAEGKGKAKEKTIVQMDQSTYKVNFTSMHQENPQDKTKIPVRRKDGLLK